VRNAERPARREPFEARETHAKDESRRAVGRVKARGAMREDSMQLLITGATGKVGRNLLDKLLREPRWREARVKALCHNRTIEETDRVEVVKGTIDDRGAVDRAMQGVTHVVHLATCKEIPETVMDVTVKGLFWLLEAFRQSF
jgi:UDP-glucose 4-epimerase